MTLKPFINLLRTGYFENFCLFYYVDATTSPSSIFQLKKVWYIEKVWLEYKKLGRLKFKFNLASGPINTWSIRRRIWELWHRSEWRNVNDKAIIDNRWTRKYLLLDRFRTKCHLQCVTGPRPKLQCALLGPLNNNYRTTFTMCLNDNCQGISSFKKSSISK